MTPEQQVKALLEPIGQQYNELSAEIKALKGRDAVTEEKINRLSENLATNHEKAVKLLDQATAKMNRTGAYGNAYTDSEKAEVANSIEFQKHCQITQAKKLTVDQEFEANVDALKAYQKAHRLYLTKGLDLMTEDQKKTLQVGVDPDGGYWVAPPTVSARVATKIFETSPLRQLATVEKISADTLEIFVDIDELTVSTTSEQGTRSATNTPQVAKKTIMVHEQYAYPTMTVRQAEDAVTDMEAWLSRKAADKFARFEATDFIAGNGVGRARGILSYPNGTSWNQVEQIGSGSSGNFTYNGLVNMAVGLKEPYQANAQWLIKRASMALIMQLQDGGGRLIFQPFVNGDLNLTPLFGYKINYANDMPGVGAGALALALGDWATAYTIVDRVGLSTLRDPYTSPGFLKYHMRRRVGGDVVNFEAFKLQVLS